MQKLCPALCTVIIFHLSSAGQSIPVDGTQSVLSRTYDTLLTGEGVGDYKISFAQWDPRQGKLVAVRIKATPRVQYGYSLKNVADSLADNYKIALGREDSISSPALATPFHKITYDTLGAFPLEPGKLQWLSPTLLDNSHDYKDSITDNFQLFEGTGKIDFSYSPTFWSKVYSDSNVSYHYNATIHDSTILSLTYFYSAEAAPKVDSPRYTKTAITAPTADKLTLYPNPAKDFIQLAFNDPAGDGDWQVDILAADGHIMQSSRYSNATQATVNFAGKLAAGAYFARVTDVRTSRTFTKSFIVIK